MAGEVRGREGERGKRGKREIWGKRGGVGNFQEANLGEICVWLSGSVEPCQREYVPTPWV